MPAPLIPLAAVGAKVAVGFIARTAVRLLPRVLARVAPKLMPRLAGMASRAGGAVMRAAKPVASGLMKGIKAGGGMVMKGIKSGGGMVMRGLKSGGNMMMRAARSVGNGAKAFVARIPGSIRSVGRGLKNAITAPFRAIKRSYMGFMARGAMVHGAVGAAKFSGSVAFTGMLVAAKLFGHARDETREQSQGVGSGPEQGGDGHSQGSSLSV